MKFYLASTWHLIHRVKETCRILEKRGHEVPVRWWTRAGLHDFFKHMDPVDFYSHPECKIAYDMDRKGVEDCDVFLLVADDEPMAYNGANIEMGIAQANDIPCFSVGTLINSALYYPVVQCSDVYEVLSTIKNGGVT